MDRDEPKPGLIRRIAATPPQSAAWLLLPILAGPAIAVMSLAETRSLPDAARTLADSTILLIPALAIFAALLPRFRPVDAALATLVFLFFDTIGMRDLLHQATQGVLHESDNPSWISLIVIGAGAALLAIATLLRATLPRIVLLIAAFAQIATLFLFHTLTVIGPIDAERRNEAALTAETTRVHGSPSVLCGVDGRRCFRGPPADLLDMVASTIPHPEATQNILRDTASSDSLLHTWTELILPSTDAEALRHISLFKWNADTALLIVNETSPTRAFEKMKLAFGILASLFQQVWVSLALLIIWRHRDYVLTAKGWRAGPGERRGRRRGATAQP